MSHKNRLHVLVVILTILGLIFHPGNAGASTPNRNVPTPLEQGTAILLNTPTVTTAAPTPTPQVQAGADPEVWLDAAIDQEQFGPTQALIVHFNTPMSPESSPRPILSWPGTEGVTTWDELYTTLTYKPTLALAGSSNYTFFLDPSLRSVDGKALKDRPDWIVRVQSGPRVVHLTPQPGSLGQRHKTIEIFFDRKMKSSTSTEMVSIEPSVDFQLKWKTDHVLQIVLQEPLQFGLRYDLTLKAGNDQNSLFAADGSYLEEEYRWFYWQQPLDTEVYTPGSTVLVVKFNYALDRQKTGLPFSINPVLEGEWEWFTSQELRFIASDPIPASQEFSLALQRPLVDANGFETSTIPALGVTGMSPVHLANPNIAKSDYTDDWIASPDVDTLRLEFVSHVNHASAEKAFSLSPAIPGKFHWEKVGNGSKEVMVYTLKELLKTSTEYQLKIDTTLLDVKGKPLMIHPYEKTFVTSDWGGYFSSSFGEGGENIQLVDLNGSRRIQFAGKGEDTSFTAYRFDLIDFAKLYAEHYHSRSYGNSVRDIPLPSGLEPSATWKNVVYRDAGEGRVTETILPNDLAAGLYVVNMSYKNVLYDQLFVVVTSNTLVVKNDGDDLFVWLTDINGKSVPDAEIRLYSSRGEKVREGKTDKNGLYQVSIPDHVDPMLVSARVLEEGRSGDVTLSGFDGWGTYDPYRYDDPASYLPDGQPYMVYIYTERPIYKPGQTVNFKAVVRKDDDVRYSLPDEGTPVNVRILDARGNSLENMTILTNRFGTINGQFDVSEGAMLGHYQVETEVDGIVTTLTFQVEDYRKPDYQIKLTSLQPEKEDKFVRDEQMKVKISASYYFGEPLANTKLDVTFYHIWPVESRVTGSLVTDENGETILTFPAPYNPDYYTYSYWGDSPAAQLIRMEVSANDGSNQTVAGVYSFLVYPAAEEVELETDGHFAQPGEAFMVTAAVHDLFEKPIAGRNLTLTSASWNWKNFEFNSPDQEFELRTDLKGIANQEIKLGAGYHKLTLTGQDAQGHVMETTRWVYVFKTKQDWFEQNRDEFLTVSAEKDSYKPYETARFVIESTFSGPALLTFERGSVINSKMIELTAPLTIVETDVIPEYAPNVYITVNAWQPASNEVGRHQWSYYLESTSDSYLRLAKTQIEVDSTAKALDIVIATDKQTYAPGETLSATIQVKDSTGKPVPAELSLAVVDESIYGLANDFAEDIFDVFYGPRGHSVTTFNSMAPYRILMYGGMGGGGGDGIPPAARTDFPDTSAWLPAVETDENGQAKVTIDLPDNTTSWRLGVKAVTLNHQVGQAITNIETKKEVFVRPVLPRVLTNGDQATLTAFIHNNSTKSQTLTVHLTAPGLEIRSQTDQVVSLKAGEVLPVGWQVRVQSAKPTQVTITVRNEEALLDAILLPLALQPAAVADVQNQSGQFSGTLTLAIPLPNVDRETSQVRLTLNRSMSGTLLNGLEYLTGYPYGCVEQTMSRALPNAVVANAAQQLGIGGTELDARLEPLVQASIQRLYGLQHTDGGWGWWTDDVSDPYQTAWVLFGLGVMEESGQTIEPKVMDRAAEWLDDAMQHSTRLDMRTRAYALYSMARAGRGDLEKTKALVTDSLYELDPFSQAALALALHEMGATQDAQKVLDVLSQSALKEAEYVYWPQPSYDGEYHSKTMASTIRTTALVLLAFAEIDPENDLVKGIVNYLADQRQGIYGWGTTNETSFTILALTQHLVHEEMQQGSTPYEVLVNGKSLAFGTLEAGNTSASVDIPLADLKDGVNTLVAMTEGGAEVYFDLSTRFDVLRDEVTAAGNIHITREYLDPKTNKPIGQFETGQLIKVRMEVQVPEAAYFMAVEDRLPGGLEALNEGLSAANQVSVGSWGYEEYYPFYWEEYGYNYKEVRGDRVVFFITSFAKGTRTFTYYARATTDGQFLALPAQAYAMYDANVWGRSESMNVTIEK